MLCTVTDRQKKHMYLVHMPRIEIDRVAIVMFLLGRQHMQLVQWHSEPHLEHMLDMWLVQGWLPCILLHMGHMQIVRSVVVLYRWGMADIEMCRSVQCMCLRNMWYRVLVQGLK